MQSETIHITNSDTDMFSPEVLQWSLLPYFTCLSEPCVRTHGQITQVWQA